MPINPNSDTKVTQNAKSDNVNYPLLGAYSGTPTSGIASSVIYDSGITLNPSTNTITAANFSGEATSAKTATKATQDANGNVITNTYATKANAITGLSVSGRTITYTRGDNSTGTIQTQDSNTTYNPMSVEEGLAGTAETSKVLTAKNLKQIIEGTIPAQANQANSVKSNLIIGTKTYNGSNEIEIVAADLGLANAMHFRGVLNSKPTTTSGYVDGDVILVKGKEYVCSDGSWIELGDEGSMKIKQTAVSDPAANGDTISFIDTISQNTNGDITVTKKTVRTATKSAAGITIVYPAASCTEFSSDSGTITPAAAQKAAKQFAIPRPNYNPSTFKGSATDKAITRYSGTEGEVQDSTILIEDVTNTKDTNQTGQVISIPAANGTKKMVYGYCTDQTDGTSFIGGLFDKDATSFPYNAGLAIGGSSGNLLWKGNKVIDKSDITNKAPTLSWGNTSTIATIDNGTTTPISLTVKMPNNPDTHYETKLFATSSSGTAHAATTDGDTYLRLFDNNTARQSINIKGAGGTSVTSDANGVITINSLIGVRADGDNVFTGTNQFDGVLKIGPDNYGTGVPTEENQIYFVEDNGITVPKPSTSQNDYVLKVSNGNPVWSTNIASGIKTTTSQSKIFVTGVTSTASTNLHYNNNIFIQDNVLMGAAWNDYAEYRICKDSFKPGQVICENGDDTLSISIERLQPGAEIISDTFGFAIGETKDAKCPVAVSGRVLAYAYEPREEFKAGDAVCAGPNGTVSKMTREEIREYPDRIIGTVSAIPSYEIWNETVKVNNRIWIKVK